MLTCTLGYFFGYYVASDICNYIKMRTGFNEIRYELDEIKLRLDRINSNVFHKNHNQV
jgi:tetrahydromethanopterin S-methyltransferase subunit G